MQTSLKNRKTQPTKNYTTFWVAYRTMCYLELCIEHIHVKNSTEPFAPVNADAKRVERLIGQVMKDISVMRLRYFLLNIEFKPDKYKGAIATYENAILLYLWEKYKIKSFKQDFHFVFCRKNDKNTCLLWNNGL